MKRILVSLGAVALAFSLSGPSLGATKTFTAGGSPGYMQWSPGRQVIHKGDRIRWRNPTGNRHTVTAYSSNWSYDKTVAPGTSESKRFRRRGTYKFRCTVPGHSQLNADGSCTGMCGRVVVRRG